MKALFGILLTICLILPGISNSAYSFYNFTVENKKIVGKITSEIEIIPESDYYMKFNINDLSLEGQNITPSTSGFSNKIKNAIAKSPRWIQNRLSKQFLEIDGDKYADLILNINKKYVDEIAFTIACSSIGNVPPVDLLLDNVLILYDNDKWIEYADIVDYDDGQGNFYSTIKYTVLENGLEKQFEYPPEIYYWYVVHQEIGSENAEYIYEEFWRDYLFNHNDLGYPLLKEKLSEIKYLWDCKSYTQSGNRLWSYSIENHPTAIEAISYWIGKTVPAQAVGDRPNQPNIIAHQHNGWCGELQKIAVATQRACLIPSVGINNIGEDHVWREFYDRGWHQNDNWWSDGGGTVDVPFVYALGWGKDMSSVFAWNGDDSIYEVTSTYIPNEDRNTICFNVMDRYLNPVDGARVTVTVWGPNDITWLKYRFFETLENIWDSLPPLLQGKIIQFLFDTINEKIDKIPDIVDGPIYSIWNYTNINGRCCFELGHNCSYIFIIQYGNLKKPLGLAKHNKIRSLKDPFDKNYSIWLPAVSPNKKKYSEMEMPLGELEFNISYNTKSYQVHNSILWIDDLGIYEKKGKIDFFIVDEDNFNKYKSGGKYNCINFLSCENSEFTINIEERNWYLVFRNNARNSNVILNFSVSAALTTSNDSVQIFYPDRNIFEKPIFDIGEKILIKGIATDDVDIYINESTNKVNIENYEWTYLLDISNFKPGEYLIIAKCADVQDEILVKLVDLSPPNINIKFPSNKDIFEKEIININGNASDNVKISKVEVKIDNLDWILADGTKNWSIDLDLSTFELGDHIISAKAYDSIGASTVKNISFVINESSHSWKPKINNFYHLPESPTNTSNIIIYANVTTNSPYKIKRVEFVLDNGTGKKSENMFRYADYPIQKRHEEDPLKNNSNYPIYGIELGQFPNGTNISYKIKAIDTANNTITSNVKSIIVQD